MAKKFKAHMMYDAKKADTHKEHLDLKEKGYGHTAPTPFKMAGFSQHATSALKAKTCNCWKGHSRVPGTKPCAPGSCEKI